MTDQQSTVVGFTEERPKKHSKCSSIWRNITVEPIGFLLFFVQFLSDSVVQNLILARTCSAGLGYNETTCDILGTGTEEAEDLEGKIQPYASNLILARSLILTVLPAFMSFFLGPWGDNYGRRPIIMLPIIGNTLMFILMAIFTIYPSIPAVYVLVATIPLPLFGGLMNSLSATSAYLAEISNEEERSVRFGYLEASYFLGVILGTALSPILFNAAGKYGDTVVFLLCVSLNVVTFLYTYVWLPESVDISKGRKKISFSYITKLMKNMLSTNFKKRPNGRRYIILTVILSLGCNLAALEGLVQTTYLFSRLRFGWSLQQFSIWAVARDLISIAGFLFYLLVITRRFKVHEGFSMILAFTMRIAQFVIMVFIPEDTGYLMYISVVVAVVSGVSGPISRSILSKNVDKEDIGKVFSLMATSQSIAPIAGTPVFTAIYKSTLNYFPGATYLYAVSLHTVNLVMFIWVYRILRRYPEPFEDYRKK